jgi:hypothetical protein
VQPWIITNNGESYAALIDDARRGIADIEAVRTYGADAAIAQLQQRRAKVSKSAVTGKTAKKRG